MANHAITKHRRPPSTTVRQWRIGGIAAIVVSMIALVVVSKGDASGAAKDFIRIYPAGTTPVTIAEDDPNSVELGVRFAVNTPGSVYGIAYYKSSRNTGTHVGSLWTASGARLAKATFTNESRTGWQTVRFASPVRVATGRKYVASYYAPKGYYSQKQWTFTNARRTIGNSTITADQGSYSYGRDAFPTDTWHKAAYYVDVLFAPDDTGADVPKPTQSASSAPPTLPVPSSSTATSSRPATSSASTSRPATSSATTSRPATSSASTSKPATSSASTSKPATSSAPAPSSSSAGSPASAPNAGVPAGTTLTPYTGPSTITQDGTVIDAKRITTALEIRAKNVVIRRSLLSSNGDEAVHVSGSLTISDSTVNGGSNGIGGDNYTATRVEVTNLTDDGFKLGNNVHVDQAWCHDMSPSPQSHADCGQMQAGVTNMSVTNSWLVGGRNSALFLAPDLGPSSNGPVTISNNVLDGGNYTLYCVDGNNGQYFVKNITITNNRFMRHSQYGPATVNVPITSSGNVWYDTGKPVGNGLN